MPFEGLSWANECICWSIIDMEGWTERVGAAESEETECVELISKRQVCKNGVQRRVLASNMRRKLEEVLLSGCALLSVACVPTWVLLSEQEVGGNWEFPIQALLHF